MAKMLINKKHVRDHILATIQRIRPGWGADRVSAQALDDINAKVRLMINGQVRQHPSVGKTFSQVL